MHSLESRYMGTNDPVARKLLSNATAAAGLTPPPDKEIKSLFLSALAPTTTEDHIRTFFVQTTPNLRADEIKSVTMVPTSKCAFVNFQTREAAEAAAQRCAMRVELDDKEVRVSWGRSRPAKK